MRTYHITLLGAVETGQRTPAWRLISVEAWALVGWIGVLVLTVWWWKAAVE